MSDNDRSLRRGFVEACNRRNRRKPPRPSRRSTAAIAISCCASRDGSRATASSRSMRCRKRSPICSEVSAVRRPAHAHCAAADTAVSRREELRDLGALRKSDRYADAPTLRSTSCRRKHMAETEPIDAARSGAFGRAAGGADCCASSTTCRSRRSPPRSTYRSARSNRACTSRSSELRDDPRIKDLFSP